MTDDSLATSAVGDYVLEAELGHGAYGRVFRGHHRDQPNVTQAIKIVDQIGNLDRLLLEPRLLSQLQHPNIVRLDDYFLHAGKIVLAMEFVGNGQTLEQYLKRRGQLSPREVRDFLTQMASALAYSHGESILHGDLKPSNILVSKTGGNPRFVISDFGVSRIVGHIQTARQISGTYSYMAPEQLRGRATTQSDLWGLGAIAYLLLTGRHPFEASTVEELSRRIAFQPLTPIGAQPTGEDFDLERIVYRLLEKDLVSRTPSARDLASSLGDVLPNNNAVARAALNRDSWDKSRQRQTKRDWQLCVMFCLLSTVLDGILGSVVTIGGALVFYYGQERRSFFRSSLGIALVIAGFILDIFIGQAIGKAIGSDGAQGLALASVLVSWPLLYFAAKHFVRARRAERDDTLLRAAVTAMVGTDRDEWHAFLERSVNVRYGDINLHQRYAEVLLNDGKPEAAIVEAKLMLQIDPYSFDTTLLLGNAYYEAGLLDECAATCNGYLAIAGHCFEFRDLANRCQPNAPAAAL